MRDSEPHEQRDDEGGGQRLQVAPLGPAKNQYIKHPDFIYLFDCSTRFSPAIPSNAYERF